MQEVMLCYYTDKYHEDRETLEHARELLRRVEERADSLYNTVGRLETENSRLETAVQARNEAIMRLFTYSIDLIARHIPIEAQEAAIDGLIVAHSPETPPIIDLTADEEI